MELTKEDHHLFVYVEINTEEVALLRELVRFETILQVRDQVIKEHDLNNKVIYIMGVFDSFRDFDDRLLDLGVSIEEQTVKLTQKHGVPVRNIAVISKNVAKVYRMLLTETVKIKMPEYLETKYKKLGASLLEKMETALKSDPIDSQGNKVKTETPDTNILGIIGRA